MLAPLVGEGLVTTWGGVNTTGAFSVIASFYCAPIAYHLGLNAYLGSPHPTWPTLEF